MNALKKCSRSDFFKQASLVAGAAIAVENSAYAAEEVPGVPVRRMGKTDLQLPMVSLGTSVGQDVNVMKFAISKGMTFIHLSATYKGGKSIKNLAEAIKGQRDKVTLGMKITWDIDDDESMDEALDKLGVDHVDIGFFHIHDADKVRDSKYKRAAERLKKKGTIRYIGLTSHKEVPECLEAGLDEGFYDVLMPAYTITEEERFLPIFERAQKQGVGVVLMKTMRGVTGAYEELVPHYLATTGITTIVKGVDSFPEIMQLIAASKTEPDQEAGIRLRKSAEVAMSGHCLMCGTCTSSCPKGLPVSDVVRCSDYYLEHASHVETAFETYQELSRKPSVAICGECSVCESACPSRVPIRHHIRRAEHILV